MSITNCICLFLLFSKGESTCKVRSIFTFLLSLQTFSISCQIKALQEGLGHCKTCWAKKPGLWEESSGEKRTHEQTKYEFRLFWMGKVICFNISVFIPPLLLTVCIHGVCAFERERVCVCVLVECYIKELTPT